MEKISLLKREKISENIYGFWFEKKENFTFLPGQFLRWRLKHDNPDNRGVERFFTIASSPKEDRILLVTKIFEKSSSFKKSLHSLRLGSFIEISGPYGDFVLEEQEKKSIILIAGGIGITPFRSMINEMIDLQRKKEVVLFYGARSCDDFVFEDVFKVAEERELIKTVYVLEDSGVALKDWKGERGVIKEDLIKKYVPEIRNSVFYVSGPKKMVEVISSHLLKGGACEDLIKTDYFPGY